MELKLVTPYDLISKNFKNQSILDEKIISWQKKFKNVNISYSIKEIDDNKVEITILYNLPSLIHEGWTYLATLEKVTTFDENENPIADEIQIFSNQKDLNLLNYRNVEFRCDHCHTNHIRKTVHLFKHQDGREYLLGSACVKEYFGLNIFQNLNKILDGYSQINDLTEDINEFFGCCSYSRSYDYKEFARLVYGIIKNEGKYISKSSCNESNEIPTSILASNCMTINTADMIEYKKIVLLKSENFDYSFVKEYWLNKDDESDFTHNVQVNFRMVNPKPGLLAYAVWEYMKEIEDFTGKKRISEKCQNSEYIGIIGEKIKGINVEIVNIYSFESIYGTTYIVKMFDENGNIIIWKTGTYQNFESGEKKIIKTAIIKAHEEYKDQKQTIIKNCKFEEINP